MKKILSMFAVAVVFLATSCGELPPYDLEKETQIVVGLEAAYAPFNWTDVTPNEYNYPISNQSGSYVDGYDIQMSKAIANDIDKELVVKAIDWDGLIGALQSGEIDVIIAGMSPTDTRKEEINFSDEYYRSEIVMVVDKTSAYASATCIADFSGASVVAQRGTLYDDVIDQIDDVNHQTPLDTYSDLILSVVSGTSDAFVAELPVAQSIVNANPGLSVVHLVDGGFSTLDSQITVAVGLRKGDTDLLDAINESLSGISIEQRDTWMEEALERSDS
jgi:ABC-type amino acid transport substrate-binding protein